MIIKTGERLYRLTGDVEIRLHCVVNINTAMGVIEVCKESFAGYNVKADINVTVDFSSLHKEMRIPFAKYRKRLILRVPTRISHEDFCDLFASDEKTEKEKKKEKEIIVETIKANLESCLQSSLSTLFVDLLQKDGFLPENVFKKEIEETIKLKLQSLQKEGIIHSFEITNEAVHP